MRKTKSGIVPRPAESGYCAGSVQDPQVLEGKKGHDMNDVVEIAPSPEVHDRPHAQPSMGIARVKDNSHSQEYPGRNYKVSKVREAVAKSREKELVDNQTGSNRRLGN